MFIQKSKILNHKSAGIESVLLSYMGEQVCLILILSQTIRVIN